MELLSLALVVCTHNFLTHSHYLTIRPSIGTLHNLISRANHCSVGLDGIPCAACLACGVGTAAPIMHALLDGAGFGAESHERQVDLLYPER